MAKTAEKIVNKTQDVAETAGEWVSDLVDNVDFDAAKETVGSTAGAVSDKLLTAAPVAALATKKAFKRSTFAGLVVTGAFAWFLDPSKGKERRSKAVEFFKNLIQSAKDKISQPETTTNPSTSNLNYNKA